MHRLVNGFLPSADLIHYSARLSIVMHSTRADTDSSIIYIPTYRLVSTNRTFLATMPRAWNDLSVDIRD